MDNTDLSKGLLDQLMDSPLLGPFLKWIRNKWNWFWGKHLVTPQVVFGSPIQRFPTRKEQEAWWYIPVNIKPSFLFKEIKDCKILLELIDKDNLSCYMYWHSDETKMKRRTIDFKSDKFFLVPIATREEGNVYVTDIYHIDDDAKVYKLEPRRDKYVFRLKVLYGGNKEQISQHYAIRNTSLNEGTVLLLK